MSQIISLLKVGQLISIPGNRHRAGLSGTIVKVNRVNIVIHDKYRFAPDGPWFESDFKWAKDDLEGAILVSPIN